MRRAAVFAFRRVSRRRIGAINSFRALSFAFPASSDDFASTHALSISSPDAVVLDRCVFHAHHGVFSAEKTLGQKFIVSCSLSVCSEDVQLAASTDSIADAPVDYRSAYAIVRRVVVDGPTRNLVETVAEDVARTILDAFDKVSEVRVRVEKPHASVGGSVDALGIDVVRRRSGNPARHRHNPPRVG